MADSTAPKHDPELDAIRTCLQVLLPLDAAARSRVMEYLDQRLAPRDGERATEASDG